MTAGVVIGSLRGLVFRCVREDGQDTSYIIICLMFLAGLLLLCVRVVPRAFFVAFRGV